MAASELRGLWRAVAWTMMVKMFAKVIDAKLPFVNALRFFFFWKKVWLAGPHFLVGSMSESEP